MRSSLTGRQVDTEPEYTSEDEDKIKAARVAAVDQWLQDFEGTMIPSVLTEEAIAQLRELYSRSIHLCYYERARYEAAEMVLLELLEPVWAEKRRLRELRNVETLAAREVWLKSPEGLEAAREAEQERIERQERCDEFWREQRRKTLEKRKAGGAI